MFKMAGMILRRMEKKNKRRKKRKENKRKNGSGESRY